MFPPERHFPFALSQPAKMTTPSRGVITVLSETEKSMPVWGLWNAVYPCHCETPTELLKTNAKGRGGFRDGAGMDVGDEGREMR